MREPTNPGPIENSEPKATSPVGRDPSYPDRARIDSDVRAFLRPASSPWIVFDRESRADFGGRALRIGAVFASSPALGQPEAPQQGEAPQLPLTDAYAPTMLVDNAPMNPMFPPTRHEPAEDPSSLVATSDVLVAARASQAPPARPAVESDPFALPPGLVRSRRAPWIAGAAVAVALLAVGGAAVYKKAPHAKHASAPAAAAAAVVAQPPSVAPVDPPRDEIAPPPAVIEMPETKPALTTGAKKVSFGKLTIKSDAKYKNVWFDGKRMLGTGQRSFLVACGMHTVAVAEKSEMKDVEVPCNGELVVK